jgi:hypothetical protein
MRLASFSLRSTAGLQKGLIRDLKDATALLDKSAHSSGMPARRRPSDNRLT